MDVSFAAENVVTCLQRVPCTLCFGQKQLETGANLKAGMI